MQIYYAQIALQILKLALPNSLRKYICWLLFCPDMGKSKNARFQFFTHEVAINFDMFGAFMKNGIFSYVQHSLSVTK